MVKRRIVLALVGVVMGLAIVDISVCVGMERRNKMVDSVANVHLRQQSAKTSLTVYPTFVRRMSGFSYVQESAGQIASYFKSCGFGSVKVSEQNPPIAGKTHMIQWQLFQQSLKLFAEYLKANPIDTDYAVLAEYLITPIPGGGQAAGGIHCFVIDAEGKVALVVLLNSHHDVFAKAKPKTVEECTAVLIKALAKQLPPKNNDKIKVRVGIYDSRAVAMAHFGKFIKDGGLEKLYDDHDKAKAAGDTKKAEELAAKGQALQKQLHMRMFGTAPIDDILEEIKKDIPKVAQAAGVDIIVGKWDIVYQRPSAKVVDITKQLVEIFEPDEETLEKIKALLEHPPVPTEDLENMKCEPQSKK